MLCYVTFKKVYHIKKGKTFYLFFLTAVAATGGGNAAIGKV